METRPSLHDMHLRYSGEDLPISGGYGGSRVDPIVINSSDPEIVARTQMQVIRGLKGARGVYWRCLSRELLGDAFPGIEKFSIETIELTPDQKITQTEAYYFDVSAVPEQDWKPIKGSEPFERLNVRFPCEVDWLHLGSVTDHETKVPGLGIALGYGAPGIKATLYIYDMSRDVPDDLSHPSVQSEFEQVANDVVAAFGPNIVAWPDPPFDGRCLKRYFKVGEGAEQCTMVALTSHRGNFVKLRVTWKRRFEFTDDAATGWIRAILAATFDVQSSIVPGSLHASANARLRYSRLTDADRGIHLALGFVPLQLGGPYRWLSQDIDDETCQGAIFRAYARDETGQPGLDVAYVLVADATADATEPDISKLEDVDVPAVDATLRTEFQRQMAADGRELLQWKPSKLRESVLGKGLQTAYVVNDKGKERQCLALRISAKHRKLVMISVFDMERSADLRAPIYDIMSKMKFFP